DQHLATFTVARAPTRVGVFALGSVSESATTEPGSVGWTYTLTNAAAQYLAAGESVTESYTVKIDDQHGSTATQTVTVTITGTNDDVTITSSAQSGSVVEDADTTPSLTDSLSAGGTVSFNDVDLIDQHLATF